MDKCLAHHGIKGMKWGVRRYQNYDGTLTVAGKRQQEKEAYKRYEQFTRDYYSGKVKKAKGNFSSCVDQYRATIDKYSNVKMDKALHDAYQMRVAKRAMTSALVICGGIGVSMILQDSKK